MIQDQDFFSQRGGEAAEFSSVIIREATKEDWLRVEDWADFSLSEDVGSVGILDGHIIAYLQWHTHPNDQNAYVISRLEVRKAFQNRGYGRQMVSRLQAQPGIRKIVASSVVWDAVPFWEKLGFLPDGYSYDDDDYDAGHYEWYSSSSLLQRM